jgi:hypothetical protein
LKTDIIKTNFTLGKYLSDFDLADPFVFNPPVASIADYDDDEN